tara:strand:- start:12534 stop:12701 length:168 start_codon:yes stop_codon:yes gene_type:complete
MTVFEYLNLRSEYENFTRGTPFEHGTISNIKKFKGCAISFNHRANEICEKILEEI